MFREGGAGPSSGKGGRHAQQDTCCDVEEESAVESLPEHRHPFVAESGESGEASAKSCSEQEPGFVRKVEAGRPGVEQSDAETS